MQNIPEKTISSWETFSKFILSVSFGNFIHMASSLIGIIKVVNSACKVVELSIQRRDDYEKILAYFQPMTAYPDRRAVIEVNLSDFNLDYLSNGDEYTAQDFIAALNEKLMSKELQGKSEEQKNKRKQIKQQISFIYFFSDSNNLKFANDIAVARGREEKTVILQKFLEDKLDDKIASSVDELPLKRNNDSQDTKLLKRQNKLVNDWRKQKWQQKSAWIHLSMDILLVLIYSVKPLLWVMSFIVSVTAITALAALFGMACILIALLDFCLGCYALFNDIHTAAYKKAGEEKWNDLSGPKKLWSGVCCFFTEGLYGDAASNIGFLLAYGVLAILLFAGISVPAVVISLSAIALVCGIISLGSSLHKTIKCQEVFNLRKIFIEVAKIVLIAIGLIALSFAVFVSTPAAIAIVGAAFVCGMVYVGMVWYKSNYDDKAQIEKVKVAINPAKIDIPLDGNTGVYDNKKRYRLFFDVTSVNQPDGLPEVIPNMASMR